MTRKKIGEKKYLTKKSQNISRWYKDVVLQAELADYSPVKGTMVIRPYGYAIWERVQEIFNGMIKPTGVENAYFPLLIPHSLLEKEKEHVEGFSPELAVVTIGGGEKLKDPLVVRPTSETIMYAMFSKWIQSWRDLPLKINQWNNVVRWEKRTYLFLRTTEFLWQEGHTAHKDEKGAKQMTIEALEWYKQLYEEYYAIPILAGVKSEAEKFPGAKTTYTIEALMPNGKALQSATSHNLGQNFSKVFNIRFQDRKGEEQNVWQTSWGLSTRSLGALILTHGDDHGLKLPPQLAPIQVVIVPIYIDRGKEKVLSFAQKVEKTLESDFRVELDKRESMTPGYKFNEWELKGVPLRIEIGQKEMRERKVAIRMRDPSATSQNGMVSIGQLKKEVGKRLEWAQKMLFTRAKDFLTNSTRNVGSYEEFKKFMTKNRGFLVAFWCGDEDCEGKIKAETKATTRLLPLNAKKERGKCIYCRKKAVYRWYFAQAY